MPRLFANQAYFTVPATWLLLPLRALFMPFTEKKSMPRNEPSLTLSRYNVTTGKTSRRPQIRIKETAKSGLSTSSPPVTRNLIGLRNRTHAIIEISGFFSFGARPFADYADAGTPTTEKDKKPQTGVLSKSEKRRSQRRSSLFLLLVAVCITYGYRALSLR